MPDDQPASVEIANPTASDDPPADTITILVAKNKKLLTKRWTRFEHGPPVETSYDKARCFEALVHPVSNIRELGSAIAEISADARAAIVRGGVAQNANRKHMLRRSLGRDGVPATLIATLRWWVGLDIENIPRPPGIDRVFDVEAVVDHVKSLLPAAFHDATCFWQFTSGHGIKPDIRIRMWFWFDRPVSDQELRRWLGERIEQKGVKPDEWEKRWPVDISLFNPAQLHYTAKPIFDGMPDPLPCRSGWREGFDDVVTVPELLPAPIPAALRALPPAVGRASWPSTTGGLMTRLGSGYYEHRADIGDHDPGGRGFLKPMKSALGAYFRAGGSSANIDWVIQDLGAAVLERQGARPDSYIQDRLRDLPDLAAWVRDKQAESESAEVDLARQLTRIPGDPAGPLLLGQRLEDVEAGCRATGFEGWACGAGLVAPLLDNVAVERDAVVLLADEDRFLPSRQAARKTIRQWQSSRRNVLMAVPRPLSMGDGFTFADLARSAGPEFVKARIEAAMTPIKLPDRVPVEDARRALQATIDRVFADLVTARPSAGHVSSLIETAPEVIAPFFKVIRVSTGVGKSREALLQAEQLARAGQKIVYLARTVALADELARRVTPGIKVRVWRGRDRENPERPGEEMCLEPVLVKTAREVLADPTEVVCPICPRRVGCAYLAQREATADIWFGANALLWHEIPAAMNGASLLIIDEAFALDGLCGFGSPILVGLSELAAPPATRSVGAEADLIVDLMPRRGKLVAALAGQPRGWLSREALVKAGLTSVDCTTAHKLEWRAKIKVKITPQTTILGLQTKFEAARGNRAIQRLAMLWPELGRLLDDDGATASGRIEIVEQIDKDTGVAYPALRLYGARPIAKGWAKLPTLHLDATANIELVRARVPHAELCADIVADEPNVRVVQYPSHTFSKAALTIDRGMLAKTWWSIVSLAQHAGGNWLIVMQKDAEEQIRAWLPKIGVLIPSFIEMGHHNALAGIDRYGDVRGIIVVGRTLPAPQTVERVAGVLTGRAIPSCGDWYPSEMVTLAACDGSMASVERDVHPDPLAEAIRRQICDDELMQIVGRGRGVNRGEANPLEVLILGNVVLPLPLDELRVWSPPTLDDELLAREGLTLSSSGDLAEAFGRNAEQIKKQRQREKRQTGTFPYKDFLYGNVPVCRFSRNPLKTGTYRRSAPRHGAQRFLYDPRIVPDIRSWLVERLGPRAEFNLSDAGGEQATAPIPDEGSLALSDDRQGQEPEDAVAAITTEQAVPDFDPDEMPIIGETDPAAPPIFSLYARPLQLDLAFAEERDEPAPLPEWSGGIAPPPIRWAILRQLRCRGLRHQDLATAVGLSRSQVTNLLGGRFGTSPTNASALKVLLDAWRVA